ncbi:MAG: succinylglutamate desuccinylase/aspartoacylase family protein [Halobacteriaceae archaeon]
MELGTASAAPGELARGRLTVTELPTGIDEQVPVIIANGTEDGPTLWLTAAIHGDEVTGLAVAQDVIVEELPDRLAGTVVCVPALNPAGLRQTSRTSYYDGDDPNRYFPDPDLTAEERPRPPAVQELIDERLYEAITDSADALIDLHTAQIGSAPFLIRDRVLYGEIREKEAAARLSREVGTVAAAFGLPVVREYAAAEYTDQNLQRSTAGAVLNNAGIPAVTVELGTHGVVDERLRAIGVRGCYNVMVELGLLEAQPPFSPAVEAPPSPVDYPVKRAVHPHTETPGIVRHHVEPGDVIEAGESVAEIVTPTGEHRATIETDHDGYVIGRYEGVAAYENDAVTSLAVRDDGDLVVPRDPE